MISKLLISTLCLSTLLSAQTRNVVEAEGSQATRKTTGAPVRPYNGTALSVEHQTPKRTDADIGHDVVKNALTDLAKNAAVEKLGLPKVLTLFPWMGEDPQALIAPAVQQAGLYGTSKASEAIGQAVNSEFLSSALPKFLISPGMATAVGIILDSDTTAPPSLDEEFGPGHESWDQIHRNALKMQDEQFKLFMQMNSLSSYRIQTMVKQQSGSAIHPVPPSVQPSSNPPAGVPAPSRAAPCSGPVSCGVK